MRRIARFGGPPRGLTLLELVIAIFVLALGSVAALKAIDQSRIGIGEDAARLLAHQAVHNRVQELRLVGAAGDGLSDTVTLGGQAFRLSVAQSSTAGGLIRVQVSAQSELGPGAVMVAFLPRRGLAK